VENLMKNVSEPDQIFLLPVFFINIDPAQIPTSEEMDPLHPDTRKRLSCAVLSLRAVFSMGPPEDTGPTLWPRVWPWIYFIYEHQEHLPTACLKAPELLWTQFLIFVSHIYGPPISVLVSSTPGFRVLLAKAWTVMPQLKQTQAFEPCLKYVSGFLGNLDFRDPVNFNELVDGAGGSVDDLARLVVQYVYDVVEGQTSWEFGSQGYYIRSLIHFIQGRHASVHGDTDTTQHASLPPLHEKFLDTLHQHKFVAAFVVGMSSLCKMDTEEDTEESFRESFELLERLLNTPSRYRWLPDAIGAGLLRMLAACTTLFAPRLDYYLRYLLNKLLPEGLVYYHVVKAMRQALVDVAHISSDEEFKALEIFDDSDIFLDLAERRVRLKEELMDDLVSTKACDNIEVRVLLARFNGWVFLTAPSVEKSTIDLAAGDVQDAKHSITARSSVRRWTGSMAGIA
jgi:hypothetical protein